MSDISIQTAIRDIILPLQNGSTTIVPQATIATNGANVGATSVTLTAPSKRFAPGQLLVFADTLGEEPLPIISVVGFVVTLDFSGLGYTGLRHTHTGTCSTNLYTDALVRLAPMLVMGDPAIFILGADEQQTMGAFRRVQHAYTMHLQYHRTLLRPDDQQMDPNLWAKRQQVAARQDLETIAHALVSNPQLTTGSGTNAADLGSRGTNKPRITKDWHVLARSQDSQQFVAALKIFVWSIDPPF